MMSAVNILSKDDRTGEPLLAVVASPSNQIGIKNRSVQNALQENQSLHGATKVTSMFILDEETTAAVAVQQRLQQVNEVLQRLQSPLQCTICLDLLSAPVTTKCGHSFCSACMHRVLSGTRGSSPCPLCLAPVTKRSLTTQIKITQIVSAVRAILDSIKKDCGLMATPSKYRPRARPHPPAVEDNSDEEEMDEPRRGTRKRFLAPDSYLDMLPLEHGPDCPDMADDGGRKRMGSGRSRRGGMGGGGGKKNLSAPDLPSLMNQEVSAAFQTCGPSSSFCKLSKSHRAMTASSSSLSGGYEEPNFSRTTGFASNRPPPAGLPRGRGRGRGVGRGRSRPPSIRGTVGVAVEATDDELVSVSQVAEQQQQLASRLKGIDSGSGFDSTVTNKASKLNISNNVMQQKPKEKVAQWLDQSSNLGFKVGLSQNLHYGSHTIGNFGTDNRRKGESATELLSPSLGAEGRAHKTSPDQQTSKKNIPQMCPSATSKELPYNSQGSTIIFDIASDPVDLNSIPLGSVKTALKRLTTTLDFQEMELPDIESITDAKGVYPSSHSGLAVPPCSSAVASTPIRGLVTDAAACDVGAISGGRDTIPDSCPVVTGDAFGVLVDTARTVGMQQYELKPTGPDKGSTQDKDESLDDVYFFRTPADGLKDEETTATSAVTKVTFSSKKRTLEESELPSIIKKKSKLAAETESRCYSSASTLSFANSQKRTGSNGSNNEPKKSDSKLVHKSMLDLESHSDQIESSLLPSCEAMPPPPAPVEGVSIAGAAARRLRPSKAATKTNIDASIGVTSATEEARLSAERTRNTRYASQLKKQLCEPPKLVATSVGIKDTKSPGWSHVVGAKKDLKTRHVGLNITGGECKLEITKLEGSVKGEIAPVHRGSSTNQVLSSGESSLEIDDQTQKFDIEHLDSRPGNLQRVQNLKRLVKNISHDNAPEANEDESNSSDSCDSSNSANSEGHEPTAAQKAAESRPSKNGFMGLSSKGGFGAATDDQLTSVPETQTSVHSPVSSCLAGGAKYAVSPAHVVKQPVSRNVSQGVPLVDGFRVPNTSAGASSKCVENSSVDQLETAVKSKSSRFQELAINGDGDCTEDVGKNETIHCRQVEGPNDTVGGIAHVAGVDQEIESSSKDITDFTAPVRRTVRSGKLRRETRSLKPTSSSSTSSVKSKLQSVKSSSRTGGLEAMSVRRSAEKPLVRAPQTKLRSSLRSCEIHPPYITTESVSIVTSTQSPSDIGAVVNFPPESCYMSAASACNVLSTGSGVPSQATTFSKPSTPTAYCDTDATKFTSLATLSSSNQLMSSAKMLTGCNNSDLHEPQGKRSATLPAGRPVQGCFYTHHRRAVVLSEEDSEGLNFEEQTITPTVYKNKRIQADLSVPRADEAVPCERRVPDTRSVAVQCDRPRDLVALECGMQTETGTSSVGVQAQLAPHHLYNHGVIPYAAMGPNCSDRCAGGGTSSLLQMAGLPPECLHAVPCSLYQAMIGMLHLAQPNPTCCHHIHQDATHVKDVGQCLGRSESSANPALAVPVESSDGPHDKTPQLEHHQPKQSSIQSTANAEVLLHGGEMPASPICASSDCNVSAAADRLLVSAGPTRRSNRKKLHEAAAVRGALMAQGASYTSIAPVLVPTVSATLPPSGSKKKGEDSGENEKLTLKSCSVRLFSPKKGEFEALPSIGTFPSTVIVDHSKDNDRPIKTALRTKLLEGDRKKESSSNKLSSEIPYFLESDSLLSAKLAQNQSKVLSHDLVSHKSQNSSSSQASVSLLDGNSNVDAHASSVEVHGLAATSASTGASVQPRLTRHNSKGAEKKETDSLAAASSPRRKKAALEEDEAIEDVASSGPDDGIVAATRGEKENRMKGAQRSSGRPRRRPLQLQQVEPSNTDLLREVNHDKVKPPRVDAALQGSKQLFSSGDTSSLTANTKRSIVKSRTDLFESISDSRNAKVTAVKKFKRIRTFDNTDSSSEDEVQKKKPNTKQSLVSFTIGSCANPVDAVSITNTRNDDAYQKNSEELRLDQFDDGLFEYFGLNKDKTENISSTTTSKQYDLNLKNKMSSSTSNVVDLHTSFDELPELGNTEAVASEDAGDSKDTKGTACEDDEDEIPGTAEVLKNVAADIARIRKMRESTLKNIKMDTGSKSSDNNEEELLSQETVVLSSTNGSVQDSDLHNRYNLTRPDKEARDSQTSLSATSRTAFTTQTRELFSRCDRSLRKVEQRLHSSQDSEDAFSSMTVEGGCRAVLDADASGRSSPRCGTKASKGSRSSSDSDVRELFKRPDASLCNDVPLNTISQLGVGEDNSLNHLSMMSTQSEVVSTQYRNRVQNEVDLLKSKMLLLQRELLNCKPSAADETDQIFDGADTVTRVTDGDSEGTVQAIDSTNSRECKNLSDDAETQNSNAATYMDGLKTDDKGDGVLDPSIIDAGDEESDMFCSQQSMTPETGASGRRVVRGEAQVAKTALQSSHSGRLVLVCTGLSAAESAQVLKLARIMKGRGAEVLRSWRSDVTHVIVRCSTDSTTDRTLKYLYGVASGCWVLSIAWINVCLQEGRLLPEGDFEAVDSTGVPGPYRGRLYRSRLFKGAALCCLPPFNDVTNEQLQDLVRLCGGTLVSSPDQFQPPNHRPGDNNGLQLIVMQADEDGDGVSRQRAQELGALHGRLVVAGDWLIECVAMYARIGLSPYVLSTPDDHLRLASGVSEGLMQETQDF